jgi:hypothetical protein
MTERLRNMTSEVMMPAYVNALLELKEREVLTLNFCYEVHKQGIELYKTLEKCNPSLVKTKEDAYSVEVTLTAEGQKLTEEIEKEQRIAAKLKF